MKALLLVLALAVQDDRVAELVRTLGHDAAEDRDKATAEPVALGESARGALEKSLRETAAPEVQARLRTLLRRLDVDKRRKEFAGGKVIDDLGAKLTIAYYQDARKLAVSMEVMNLGSTEKTIPALERWNVHFPYASSRSANSEGEIRVKQLTGQTKSSLSCLIACGPRPERLSIVLKPGESRAFKHIIDASELVAGEHQVTGAFLKSVLGTSEDLESDALKFTVEK